MIICTSSMYELYEQSAVWKQLTARSPNYYNFTQRQRALLCTAVDQASQGFDYFQQLHLQSVPGTDYAWANLYADAIDGVHNFQSHEPFDGFIELGHRQGDAYPSPGSGTRVELSQRILPLALHGETAVVLFIKVAPAIASAMLDFMYPTPVVRYSLIENQLRAKIADAQPRTPAEGIHAALNADTLIAAAQRTHAETAPAAPPAAVPDATRARPVQTVM